MHMTDAEYDALKRTGTFLTLFGRTYDGHQMWRFVGCFALFDAALLLCANLF